MAPSLPAHTGAGRGPPAQRERGFDIGTDLARIARLLNRHIIAGLRAYGALLGLAPPEAALPASPGRDGATAPRRLQLPPGHPERLLPHLPPTAQEAALWRQLGDLDDPLRAPGGPPPTGQGR
ncbi:DUF6059 family protein [Kitasatospora sp. NPDC058170]|uniref:DUF6059 family protein n=1 Tax=Kitasatospora sp. NPDC058170 TaxID=3346364 RepID=UPI0036DA8C83